MRIQTAVLKGGDLIDFYEETNDGIETDCGLIPWRLVEGFAVVHSNGQTMFIPK